MDRIERHDFVNAVLLAAVLMAMAFGLVAATRSLFGALDEGVVEAESSEEATTTTPPTTTATAVDDTVDEPVETTVQPRPPSEVQVRVGNGAGKSGVAGAGTSILTNAGYVTLGAKNSTIKLDQSTVYYDEGYEADAEVIANLLNIPITNTAPMVADPGVAKETASVIIILGADTTL